MADLEERQDAIRVKVSVLVAQHAAKLGLSTHVDGGPALIDAIARDSGWATIMCELPLADLAVVAQSSVAFEGPWSGPLGEVLMEGRAPVFVARGAAPAAGRPAAVAWDGSLEAGRAVRAALPLLRDASEVAILQDPDGLDTSPRSQADPDRLIAYLRRHGVRAEKVVNVRGRKIGPTLLQAAIDFNAGLLVSGAYHHSRLAEAVFGGATHTFLSQGDGPHLLIAH
jgi:nucleotide-binding universal stress UspA family protein